MRHRLSIIVRFVLIAAAVYYPAVTALILLTAK